VTTPDDIRRLLGDDALVTEAEAAAILCVAPDTLRLMRKAGEIPCGRMGKRYVYSLGVLRRVARLAVAA
jgi:hypothetical protein